jgi:hypothetical protein
MNGQTWPRFRKTVSGPSSRRALPMPDPPVFAIRISSTGGAGPGSLLG